MKTKIIAVFGGLISGFIIALVIIGAVSFVQRFKTEPHTNESESDQLEYGMSVITWISDPMLVSKRLIENEMNDDMINKKGKWTTNYRTYGLATFSLANNECTIYAYEPRSVSDSQYMETLGHEMLHCFRGSFHADVDTS